MGNLSHTPNHLAIARVYFSKLQQFNLNKPHNMSLLFFFLVFRTSLDLLFSVIDAIYSRPRFVF